jgi:thiosulfate dehydrogenase [quinone] large subunit
MARTMVRRATIEDPPLARFLFSNTATAWFWLVVRLWVGYQWIEAAFHKVTNPAWVHTGAAVKTFWEAAVVVPARGQPPIAFGWYREFIRYLLATHSYTWFARIVAVGELAVGFALVLGVFVGISAFFGGLMNWSYLMAGTVSTNPVLFVAAILLMLGWKVAGYIGLDYYLLPMLGTPWRPGRIFGGQRRAHPTPA